MREILNFYCDETCHLENDNSNVMVLGAVYCPHSKRKEIFSRIRDIKEENGLSPNFEIKWNKVSAAKLNFYKQIIDYFFDDDDLYFRGLIVPDKSILRHNDFSQTHDDFYYKIYFDMLKVVLNPDYSNNIYIDIKDTRSQDKVDKLCEVLRSSHYDYKNQIVKKVQQIRSEEVEILQITDLLIGALGYFHRNLTGNSGKLELIKRIQNRSGYSLLKNTFFKEKKLNLLIWRSSYE